MQYLIVSNTYRSKNRNRSKDSCSIVSEHNLIYNLLNKNIKEVYKLGENCINDFKNDLEKLNKDILENKIEKLQLELDKLKE